MSATLELIELSRHFGALKANDGISLSFAPDECHAIIGPNGCGKSTMVGQIAGEIRPTSGRILFAGEDITNLKPNERARRRLVRSYQITALFEEFTVAENLQVALLGSNGSSLGLMRPLSGRRAEVEIVEAVLERCGLMPLAPVEVKALGYGERRQVELAMALAMSPSFLVLDEPLAGMSAAESEDVVRMLNSIKRECPILLVEHDMAAVFSLADRITVLVEGRVIASGPPEDVRDSEAVRLAYLGEEEF